MIPALEESKINAFYIKPSKGIFSTDSGESCNTSLMEGQGGLVASCLLKEGSKHTQLVLVVFWQFLGPVSHPLVSGQSVGEVGALLKTMEKQVFTTH